MKYPVYYFVRWTNPQTGLEMQRRFKKFNDAKLKLDSLLAVIPESEARIIRSRA